LVAIVNQETGVKDAADIHLYLDGVQIPDVSLNREFGSGDAAAPFYGDGHGVHKFNPLSSSWPTVFPGATITYPITNNFPPLSTHTNMVVFEDDQNIWHTNSWTWTTDYPYLFASNSLPLGSLTVTGFATRTVWVPAIPNNSYPGVINSSASAQMLLNNTSFSPVNARSTNTAQTVGWGTTAGDFTGAAPFPGLYFTNGYFETMAVQAQGYLQLAAGTNTFHIDGDDTFGMYSPGDPSNPGTVLFDTPYNQNPNVDFVVVAQAAGLYPVNIYYMNGGGPAHCLLQSYDSGNTLHIVGDVANGGMPVYSGPYIPAGPTLWSTAQILKSGTSWSQETGATVNTGTKTITLTQPAGSRYYQLRSATALTITKVSRASGNIVLTYQ
jgi:hypothetical protein